MEIASQNSVDIIKTFLIKKSKTVKEDSNISPKFDNIIQLGVNNLLNCEGDIDQINKIFRNIEHRVYKCRQHGVKNVFLSGLINTKLTSRTAD